MSEISLAYLGAPRGYDQYGSGAFAASRGQRAHMGVDIRAEPGVDICSPITGTVLRIGFPYSDDTSYRLIEILSEDRTHIVRLFYVKPDCRVGERVHAYEPIGTAQDIAKRYGVGMRNHIHVELYVDPLIFMEPMEGRIHREA